MNNDEKITTGDVNSKEMGTGARKSNGKPDYSLCYSPHLMTVIPDNNHTVLVWELLDHLGDFQVTGSASKIHQAYDQATAILKTISDDYRYSELDAAVSVMTQGAEKYQPFNWMKGMPWSVPMGCIHRHILKQFAMGEVLDSESGQPHIAHVICNIQMLMFYIKYYPEGNDLPASVVNFNLDD